MTAPTSPPPTPEDELFCFRTEGGTGGTHNWRAIGAGPYHCGRCGKPMPVLAIPAPCSSCEQLREALRSEREARAAAERERDAENGPDARAMRSQLMEAFDAVEDMHLEGATIADRVRSLRARAAAAEAEVATLQEAAAALTNEFEEVWDAGGRFPALAEKVAALRALASGRGGGAPTKTTTQEGT